jgi:hypothetical protein
MMLQKVGSWPPDYVSHIQWRAETLRLLSTDRDLLLGAQKTYLKDPAQFIDDWVDTIDPRNAAGGQLVRMPFRLFPRQFDLIDFFQDCLEAEAHGLVEKSLRVPTMLAPARGEKVSRWGPLKSHSSTE